MLCVGTILITATMVVLTIFNKRQRQQMRVQKEKVCVEEISVVSEKAALCKCKKSVSIALLQYISIWKCDTFS